LCGARFAVREADRRLDTRRLLSIDGCSRCGRRCGRLLGAVSAIRATKVGCRN
jgi:hypothetical protein